MLLFDIVKGLSYKLINGENVEVKSLTIDSRQISIGSMFFCISGLRVDGHEFINEAIAHGVSVIVIDKEVSLPSNVNNVSIIKVENARKALAICCINFYSTSNLSLIGVTGTNGKTSTTYFLDSIFRNCSRNTGVIGTIDSRINGKHIDVYYATTTTPDAIELHKILAIMSEQNVDDVIMEVSSHALALYKVNGLRFKVGVFTNLTQDHLDFHETMEKYLDAKLLLFQNSETGIVNADDKASKYIMANAACKFVTYGIESDCDVRAKNIVYDRDFVSFDVHIDNAIENFKIPIPGKFTVYNALSSICTAYVCGITLDNIKLGLMNMKNVPGRLQRINHNKTVIVDYAHSPDGLQNVLETVRGFTKGKVITVFGCGGDRDKLKRPIMGQIANQLSDYVIITSDNPRTEDPEKIIDEIESGMSNKNHERVADRYAAIQKAISLCDENDSVVIAGKGHENYQIFADRTIHFDDVEVAEEILGVRV